MDLLLEYDRISISDQINILGKHFKSWDPPKRYQSPNKSPNKLLLWTLNEEWNPIQNHGSLFLGVIHNPTIVKVAFKVGNGPPQEAKIVNGYWRLGEYPIVMASLKEELLVQVISLHECIELAWLIISDSNHENILKNILYDSNEKIFDEFSGS